MTSKQREIWDLWYPMAGATGLSFARSRIAGSPQLILVHAVPPVLTVTVRLEDGQVIAMGKDLEQTDNTPMARLVRHGDQLERKDIWPAQPDIGQLVLLPGGEAGVLKQWWHAADHSEWRWQLEFYNHR